MVPNCHSKTLSKARNSMSKCLSKIKGMRLEQRAGPEHGPVLYAVSRYFSYPGTVTEGLEAEENCS